MNVEASVPADEIDGQIRMKKRAAEGGMGRDLLSAFGLRVQETASPWRLREPADEADFGAVLERKNPGTRSIILIFWNNLLYP